jgi:hypothetical protein
MSRRPASVLASPTLRRPPWRSSQRATSVLLMLRQLALPLAGDVEEIDDLIRLEERAPRLRHLHTAPAPARGVGVEQAVLDSVVEDLREHVERHVHGPRGEPGRVKLLAKVINATSV